MSYKLKLRWQVHIDDDLDHDASETSISSARRAAMEVVDRQDFLFAFFQPALSMHVLAFGAVAVKGKQHLMDFQRYYEQVAKPFEWKFTRQISPMCTFRTASSSAWTCFI
jgi:hypothetical protein